ncbi:MAG: hypothetical protein ACD_45C00101G0002, partial [uncultured bacterium]
MQKLSNALAEFAGVCWPDIVDGDVVPSTAGADDGASPPIAGPSADEE